MKINWKKALIFSLLIMIGLPFVRNYILLRFPWMPQAYLIPILFVSAKLMGSLLEIMSSYSSLRFYIDDFLEELLIFVLMGFACWLFILGAETYIGGKVEYVVIPPVAYFLINSLYREVAKDGHKLV